MMPLPKNDETILHFRKNCGGKDSLDPVSKWMKERTNKHISKSNLEGIHWKWSSYNGATGEMKNIPWKAACEICQEKQCSEEIGKDFSVL